MNKSEFENLSPDLVIDAVEAGLDIDLTGYTQPMPSYINRVFELKDDEGNYYIVKFYRPGRWSDKAILEEHRFILDCEASDIPVAAPLKLTGLVDDGDESSAPTLGRIEGMPFAVFPRKGGRLWESSDEEAWGRVGSLLARIHNVGSERQAKNRITLTASEGFAADVDKLLGSDWVPQELYADLEASVTRLQESVDNLFSEYGNDELIRVHGDFHSGNLLERPGEGLMVIDFDDMSMSLPVQDLWLLLPDHAPDSGKEIALILEGYREFRSFNTETLMLIEPLRAMRMIYFLCWCGSQRHDYKFQQHFPDWGSRAFWQKEIEDLNTQHDQIKRAVQEQNVIF